MGQNETYLYNSRRPHSTLDGQTPDTLYFANLPALEQAPWITLHPQGST